MEDKPCEECGYNKLDKTFCDCCFTCRSSVGWKSKDDVILEFYQKIIELEKKNKECRLEKLKSDKKLFEFYSKYGDCGDDYYDNVDKINNQIEKLEKELNFDNSIK